MDSNINEVPLGSIKSFCYMLVLWTRKCIWLPVKTLSYSHIVNFTSHWLVTLRFQTLVFNALSRYINIINLFCLNIDCNTVCCYSQRKYTYTCSAKIYSRMKIFNILNGKVWTLNPWNYTRGILRILLHKYPTIHGIFTSSTHCVY